jgi:hypothetical protein
VGIYVLAADVHDPNPFGLRFVDCPESIVYQDSIDHDRRRRIDELRLSVNERITGNREAKLKQASARIEILAREELSRASENADLRQGRIRPEARSGSRPLRR